LFESIVPVLPHTGLVGEESLFTEFALTIGMDLYVNEKFSQGSYSFVGPLKLRHLLDERCLGNGHLSKGEVGIRHNIFGGPKCGDLSEGYDIIYFGEPKSVVVLSVLMLSSICATFLSQVP
jgi:hypothetical protein